VINGDVVEDWTVVTEPIERFGPNDKVVEVNFFDDQALFLFGDNITGKVPLSGSTITFRYRTGGGRRGRIGASVIDTQRAIVPDAPANVSQLVLFRNVTASVGGTDKESIAEAKKRAPRDFAVRKSIVTSADYAQSASNFSHPVYGAVSKSLATIRTGFNANSVEIYVLAVGPDDIPVTPSIGLKNALKTYFSDLNVLTDNVKVLDGQLYPLDLEYTVIIDKNSDASIIKERVETRVTEYFDVDNWEMGQPFYISNFIETVGQIDGVKYVDLLNPANNVLATGDLSVGDGVSLNELITIGTRKSDFYYDKTRRV
jgi:hypothetical protein